MCVVYQSAGYIRNYSLIFGIPNVLNCNDVIVFVFWKKCLKLFSFPRLFSLEYEIQIYKLLQRINMQS